MYKEKESSRGEVKKNQRRDWQKKIIVKEPDLTMTRYCFHVVRLETIRIIISLSVQKRWRMHELCMSLVQFLFGIEFTCLFYTSVTFKLIFWFRLVDHLYSLCFELIYVGTTLKCYNNIVVLTTKSDLNVNLIHITLIECQC